MVESTNKLGHRIGARGGRTRQAILDATRNLLNARHYGDIRVSDLASAAGVSPSNFYTYFKTVEEPVLALCESALNFCCDRVGAIPIVGQVPKHILNPGFGCQIDPRDA